jgi:NTP pyrophosphatase (non-canonical NTP hydrolase)
MSEDSATDDRLRALDAELAAFNAARDWGRFHTPRELATALTIESGELLELFLWRGEDPALPDRARLTEELGDVVICLLNFARSVGLDPLEAARAKLALNALRYPVEASRGHARKYTELQVQAAADPAAGSLQHQSLQHQASPAKAVDPDGLVHDPPDP